MELQLYNAKKYTFLHHFGQIQLFKHVSGAAFHTETNFTLGWEHAVRSQTPGTGVSSGRCAAAPCAWWRLRCDGTVVPPGTL